jgi:xylan 1,4-beta-xylosidase
MFAWASPVSNAFTAWQRLGSPAAPTPDQYLELEQAAQLAEFEPQREIAMTGPRVALTFALPRQAVSLLVLEWD